VIATPSTIMIGVRILRIAIGILGGDVQPLRPGLAAPRTQGRRQGFTLLEVLLAMALVSVVAVSLFASLGVAYRARESARSTMNPVRAVHVALETIGKDLSGALAPTGILAGSFLGVRSTAASGLADAIEFYRLAPLGPDLLAATGGAVQGRPTTGAAGAVQGGPPSATAGAAQARSLSGIVGGWAGASYVTGRVAGIQRVELSLGLLSGETLPALLRQTTSNLLAPVLVEPDVEVLCRNVTSFGARYFDGTYWQESWDSTTLDNTLPAAVQVYLRVEWPAWRSASPVVYEATRTFVLACRQESSSTASSSSSGGSSSQGAGS